MGDFSLEVHFVPFFSARSSASRALIVVTISLQVCVCVHVELGGGATQHGKIQPGSFSGHFKHFYFFFLLCMCVFIELTPPPKPT